jgi:predicted dehydrogenase
MKFANGVMAQISCGFRTPFREGAHIIGDKGIIQIIEPWKPGLFGKDSQVIFIGSDDSRETLVIPATDPYSAEVAAMEACILDGAEPVVPLSLSRDFLRSVLGLYESAATGQVVKLLRPQTEDRRPPPN